RAPGSPRAHRLYITRENTSRLAHMIHTTFTRAPMKPSFAQISSRACRPKCSVTSRRGNMVLRVGTQELASDIELGSLNKQITEHSIKKCMSDILKESKSELAEFIRSECSKENWDRIIARIWPNTKYLDVIVTGAMAQYIPTLDDYSGGLPLACTMLNLNPVCKPSEVSYTIRPNMAYFEFLPHEPAGISDLDLHRKLVDLVGVE
ncbi:hypothetical protein Tsubulata_039018, partial [Turnera subulata]